MSATGRTTTHETSSDRRRIRGERLVPQSRRAVCGGKVSPGTGCKSCGTGGLRRKASTAGRTGIAPPIVHQVLRSPGSPLESGTRIWMEQRFRHDFGSVRVHTDDKAAKSALAVDALAYT